MLLPTLFVFVCVFSAMKVKTKHNSSGCHKCHIDRQSKYNKTTEATTKEATINSTIIQTYHSNTHTHTFGLMAINYFGPAICWWGLINYVAKKKQKQQQQQQQQIRFQLRMQLTCSFCGRFISVSSSDLVKRTGFLLILNVVMMLFSCGFFSLRFLCIFIKRESSLRRVCDEKRAWGAKFKFKWKCL